jgi:hypothetical protein
MFTGDMFQLWSSEESTFLVAKRIIRSPSPLKVDKLRDSRTQQFRKKVEDRLKMVEEWKPWQTLFQATNGQLQVF